MTSTGADSIREGATTDELDGILLQRRAPLRAISAVATVALLFGSLFVVIPSAVAVKNTCWAKNLTQGSPSRSNLQVAISAAHDGDKISVKGVCVGSFTIDTDITLVGHRDPGGAKPVLHGEGAWERVLRVAARVTLTNLKVTGGLTRGAQAGHAGGGILVWKGGILTLNRSVIRGNSSKYEGGGIANYGRLVLNGSSVTRNSAPDGVGGGISNYGDLTMNGSSLVRGNTAKLWGGGIANHGTLVMNDSSTVGGNGAYEGGGILLETPRHGPDPTLTMNDSSSASGNHATNDGGGIFVSGGTVTLKNSSSVRGNDATNAGGGIAVLGGGTLVMRHSSSVRGNTASLGGGIYLDPLWPTVTMSGSSSVHGNTAEDGGGIFNLGKLTMNDISSVTENTADSGGGIRNQGTIAMNDSSSVNGNTAEGTGGGIFLIGIVPHNGSVTLKGSSSVYDNTAATSGGIYLSEDSTFSACDGTSVDDWIGTVEPNDPNDFLDSDVSLIPSGTEDCA